MTSPRSEFINGSKAITPILIGVVPFALLAGVTAVAVGMAEIEGIGMSLIVYAGAAQLVAIQLVGQDVPTAVIWMSTLFINMRFFMYSASIAPYWEKMSLPWKLPMGFLLTDQAYAVSIIHYGENQERKHKRYFYLGTAIPFWLVWQAGTAVGVFIGVLIPQSWQLTFAVPLTFLALLMATIKDQATAVAALTGGVTAVIARPLPYNLGLLLAAIIGISAGFLFQSRLGSPDEITD